MIEQSLLSNCCCKTVKVCKIYFIFLISKQKGKSKQKEKRIEVEKHNIRPFSSYNFKLKYLNKHPLSLLLFSRLLLVQFMFSQFQL